MAVRSLLSRAGLAALWRRLFGGGPGGGDDGPRLIADTYGRTEAMVTLGPVQSLRLADVETLRNAVIHNPWALDAVRLIAEEIATRPVRLSVPDGNGWIDLKPNHPALVFLNHYVHQRTPHQYVQRGIVDALITGDAMAEVKGKPSRSFPGLGVLVQLDPGDVTPQVSEDELTLLGYLLNLKGFDHRVIEPGRLIHHSVNPVRGGAGGFLGVSPFYPLLPELQGDRADAIHERDSARGAPRNLKLSITDGSSLLDKAPVIESMVEIRRRAGYHVAPKGIDIDSLTADKESEDISARRARLSETITLTMGLAPVLRNQSVTNDSAAKEQHRQWRRNLHWLSRDWWAPHVRPLAALFTDDEIAAGVTFRTDWGGDIEDERLTEAERRAALLKTYTEAGMPLDQAMALAGINAPTVTREATHEDDRDPARLAPRSLRALPGGRRAVR